MKKENKQSTLISKARKKYTKIYTSTTEVSDWANKQVILDGMGQLFHDSALHSLFKKIVLAVESMEAGEDEKEQGERDVYLEHHTTVKISKGAFNRFVEAQGIHSHLYRIKIELLLFFFPCFGNRKNHLVVTGKNGGGTIRPSLIGLNLEVY